MRSILAVLVVLPWCVGSCCLAHYPVNMSATRGAAWSEKEMKTLIGIWSDKKVQEELEGSTRNKEIYKKIAKEMGDNG